MVTQLIEKCGFIPYLETLKIMFGLKEKGDPEQLAAMDDIFKNGQYITDKMNTIIDSNNMTNKRFAWIVRLCPSDCPHM